MTIYQRLLEANCELDNHESDLYVKSTPEAREIILKYRSENLHSPLTVRTFKSETDGTPWLDLPFQYDPWWETKGL